MSIFFRWKYDKNFPSICSLHYQKVVYFIADMPYLFFSGFLISETASMSKVISLNPDIEYIIETSGCKNIIMGKIFNAQHALSQIGHLEWK